MNDIEDEADENNEDDYGDDMEERDHDSNTYSAKESSEMQARSETIDSGPFAKVQFMVCYWEM